jgi:uncharacterized protein YidB (DUF937 family)
MANLIFSILSEYNGKGLAKGKKDVVTFEKTLKSLGKTLGVTLGAAALVNFGKKAVAAFAADEKAAKSLEIQLKNTGYQFSAPDVEYYIANLQKMTGVLDDYLRPAFQTLLTASGSLIQSQKALAVALDVSAATGKSVEEVSAALAKGFTGQTTALSRLGAGLDKATLASGDMGKIMDELNRKFAGQSAARLDTYAGKMDKLKVATADATEIIGKGLLDALSTLGTDKSLDKFANDLNSTATAISYLVAGVASLAGEINKLFNMKIGSGSALDFILRNAPVISAYYNAGKSATAAANAPSSNFTYSLGANAGNELAKLQELKARKALIVTLKAEADLKKLKDKYDMERIQLTAALNQATDEETKLRLAEKLAILDGNAAMAAKYLADLDATDSTTQLAQAMNQAAMDILSAGQMVLLGLGVSPSQMAGSTITGTGGFPDIRNLANVALNNPNFGTSPEAMGLGLALGFTPGGSGGSAPNITVNVDATNMVDPANMTKVVQESLLIISKNGYSTVPAGQGF